MESARVKTDLGNEERNRLTVISRIHECWEMGRCDKRAGDYSEPPQMR